MIARCRRTGWTADLAIAAALFAAACSPAADPLDPADGRDGLPGDVVGDVILEGDGPCDPVDCAARCAAIGFPVGACVGGACSCSGGGGDADADPDGDVPLPDDGGGETVSDAPLACPPDPGDGCGAAEICNNGSDDNCNGQVDEGCNCVPGEVQSCFAGPPGRRGIGGCVDGTQICRGFEFGTWDPCEGGILPESEICDGKDNDCNDCVDDLDECRPNVLCPTERSAAPLSDYALRCDDFYPAGGADCTWEVVAPAGSATTGAADPRAENTTVRLDISGDYYVTVTIVDPFGVTHTCTFVIRVRGQGIRVEMWWNEGVTGDTSSDVDLHFHRDRATGWFNGDDCYYANCTVWPRGVYSLSWGYPISDPSACETSRCPNPRLDIDDVQGWGPENANLEGAGDGERFRVAVHYYDADTWGSHADVNVRIYCGGIARAVFGPARITNNSAGTGDIWRVADITARGPTGDDCEITSLAGTSGFDVRPDSSRSTF